MSISFSYCHLDNLGLQAVDLPLTEKHLRAEYHSSVATKCDIMEEI